MNAKYSHMINFPGGSKTGGLIESIGREFSWKRPIKTYNKVQIIYSKFIRGRNFQLKKIRRRNLKYLNIGCGNNSHKHCINVDFQWRPNVDLCWDITKGLPFESNSIEGIYTEHCLEHITYSQCMEVSKVFLRILKPGGTIRIIVPDVELYIDLYQKEKRGEDIAFPYVTEEHINNGFTPVMALNRIFREHSHKYAYDTRTLKMVLKKIGFVKVKSVSFKKGRDSNLILDSDSRKIESLYLEAQKGTQ